MGTFQPLQHRSGTLRERLHSYTKRTLGAGGSMNEAVREPVWQRYFLCWNSSFSHSFDFR